MKENQNLFRDLQEDFRKMKKNLLVAQSGGPTAAINATLAGVIKQAIKEEQIDQVYGACYGIQGVLEQKFVNLTEKVDTEEKLEKLKRTPAAALGSCRFKLNDIKEDDSQYQEIVDILHKMNIGYFVYIGGNDSMDTVAKLSAYCKEKGVEDIKVIGIRHGEKLYATLLTREECAKPVDMGNFYRVPADNRSLNYDKYFTEGNSKQVELTEFNSDNTRRLNLQETKDTIASLEFSDNEWNGIPSIQ